MPSKRSLKQKKGSPQERKSGRQNSKQITYTEEESDDYSSGSEIEIHDEIDKIIENIPVRKPPKKDKNVRNQGRQEKRKVDDSESEKESDDDYETAEETPSKKPSKKKEVKQSPAKKQKTKVNYTPAEDDDGCQICKRTSQVGIRSGIQCCKPCLSFFRRYTKTEGEELICKEDDRCDLDSTQYVQICPCCRYKKCLDLGMEPEEESVQEGERKSTRIRSLEKNYKESDSESEDDIYIPIAKKKRKPNYYESSDENAVRDSSDEEDDSDDLDDINWNPSNRMTLMDVTFGKRKKKRENCAVCRDSAHIENNYGVRSCYTCVDIFRKALKKYHIPRCIKKNKQCDVKSGKSKCKMCTISRYLKLVMESDKYIENGNIKQKAEYLEELLLSDNPQKLAMKKNKCEICGGLAGGLTNGVKTCDSCTKFFKKCANGKLKASKFKCLQSDMCKVSRGEDPVKYRGSFCKDCRYKKCLKVGMAKGNRSSDE